MFWYLGLAHLLGDYPLQPDWIVRHKTKFWVLLLHVSIHFAVMLAIFYPASAVLWPYLLALTAVHFGIDAAKNWFRIHRPAWISWPYLIDQAIHIISLVLTSIWISHVAGISPLAIPPGPVIFGVGLLSATYVWLITEKVLRFGFQYPVTVNTATAWQRLFFRAALFAVLLFGRQVLSPPAAASLFLVLPYSTTREGKLFFITDLAVALGAVILVILAGQPLLFR